MWGFCKNGNESSGPVKGGLQQINFRYELNAFHLFFAVASCFIKVLMNCLRGLVNSPILPLFTITLIVDI
jgi:hypothetical protein